MAETVRKVDYFYIETPDKPGEGAKALASHLKPLTPIGDVRASREYRSETALTLVRRMLDQLGAIP